MADLSKFEQMLERLINEDRDGAQELFHDIVVEKSRNIYEALLESDCDDDEEDYEKESIEDDDDDDDDDDETNEDFNLDEFEIEADDDMMGGDPTDDMLGDLGAEDGEDDEVDFGMSDGGEDSEGDVEDRVVDLEDALDDLKAEFDKLMGGEDDMGFVPGDDDDEQEFGDEGEDDEEDDFGDDEDEDDEEEEESFQFEGKKKDEKDEKGKKAKAKTANEQMREYVEKVSGGHGAEKKGSGDNGANTKSAVAGPNKMGDGTTQNIARGDTNDGGEHAGLGDLNAKDQDAGNINKPGAKASKKQSTVSKGHGTEKKGSGESGAYTKPIIGGSKKK